MLEEAIDLSYCCFDQQVKEFHPKELVQEVPLFLGNCSKRSKVADQVKVQ